MKRFTAILVDDEIWALRGLKGIADWESLGYEIIGTYTDSVEAFEHVSSEKPDVLFTDIRMPDIDGMSLIEKVKEVSPETSFVIVSAYRDFEIAKKALKNDVSDYLIKPLDKEEVKNTLSILYENLCTRKKSSASLKDFDISDLSVLSAPQVERLLNPLLSKNARIIISSERLSFPGEIYIKGFPFAYIAEGDSFVKEGKRLGLSTADITLESISAKISEAKKSYLGGFLFSDNEQTAKIQEYLFDNLEKKMSMDDLAASMFLSKPYIFELFRANCDDSAMSFLKNIRLNVAADLLKKPGSTVNSVAEAVGFEDPGYFIKNFKAKFGCTPEQYSTK